MSLYLTFTGTHIIEEDFTKTLGFELSSFQRLKAIDLTIPFRGDLQKKPKKELGANPKTQ